MTTMVQQQIQEKKVTPGSTTTPPSEAMLVGERGRLVRLCTRLTGKPDVAEDLAQETLLEAWRNLHKFDLRTVSTQPEAWTKWLTAIARNVCKRWGRSHSQDLSHSTLFAQFADDGTEPSLEDLPDTGYDLELELERDEMAQLLDRALALLPPSVRDVLIERYIRESPHAEIAERFGLSEDALVQRLYRGKLALRRAITDYMPEEAAEYGMVALEEEKLRQETRIWCPMCSKARLIKYFDPVSNKTGFTCPECWHIAGLQYSDVWDGINSPKAILARQLAWLGDYYWRAINMQQVNCKICGELALARIYQPQDLPPDPEVVPHCGVYLLCTACGLLDANSFPHLTLDTPEARQFWRKHPRMYWQPYGEIDYAGQPALISRFQSVSDAARLDVICQRSTLKILGIHESSH